MSDTQDVAVSSQTAQPQSVKSNRKGAKGISQSDLRRLALAGLNYAEIGRTLGCHETNVLRRLKPEAEAIKRMRIFQDHRADVFSLEQMRYLGHISEEKLTKTPARDLVWMLGVIHDKEMGVREGNRSAAVLQVSFTNYGSGPSALVVHPQDVVSGDARECEQLPSDNDIKE